MYFYYSVLMWPLLDKSYYIKLHRFMPSCPPFDAHKVWYGLLATASTNADAF